MSVKRISETNIGVYLWEMPDGRWVADQDMNFLNVPALRGDLRAIASITKVAKALGLEEGRPVFSEGHRRVTDAEYEDQVARLQSGLVPDELDIGVYKDELKKHD